MKAQCDKNCFACPYEDCICDDLAYGDYKAEKEIDILSGAVELKTPSNIRAAQRKYREKNKEKIAAYQRKYYEKNKEKIAAYNRKYREKNKEKIAAYKRKYREKNKEQLQKERRKQWQQK